MPFSEDVEKSASQNSENKVDYMDTNITKVIITETELRDNATRPKSRWRRLMDASSRQLSIEEVGRKRAWYARGVAVLALFSTIGALGFL
jgi:hypothetical protein